MQTYLGIRRDQHNIGNIWKLTCTSDITRDWKIWAKSKVGSTWGCKMSFGKGIGTCILDLEIGIFSLGFWSFGFRVSGIQVGSWNRLEAGIWTLAWHLNFHLGCGYGFGLGFGIWSGLGFDQVRFRIHLNVDYGWIRNGPGFEAGWIRNLSQKTAILHEIRERIFIQKNVKWPNILSCALSDSVRKVPSNALVRSQIRSLWGHCRWSWTSKL